MGKRTEKILFAGITVEASYVVPVMIGVIFAVMMVSFYFYDITVTQAILNKNAVKLKNVLIHPYEKDISFYDYDIVNEKNLYFQEDYSQQERSGREKIKKEMVSALIFLHVKTVDITIKNKKIIASAELCFNRKTPFGIQYIPFWGKTKKVMTEITVYYPADFVRILEVISQKK